MIWLGTLIPNLGFEGGSPSFVSYTDMRLLQLGSYRAVLGPKYELL